MSGLHGVDHQIAEIRKAATTIVCLADAWEATETPERHKIVIEEGCSDLIKKIADQVDHLLAIPIVDNR